MITDPAATDCDALVVGGGINGCGIARDLAGRGWRVVLVERDDLAAHTSSASTKLLHGGLRYLEHYEFGLVRKALAERERLLRAAPHIAWPLRFVLPHEPSMRPAWLIRAGLLLYDHLARRALLPPSQALDLRRDPAGAALQPHLQRGFSYWDGWVDDARLVVLNAVDARERGARVLTRTALVGAQRGAGHWQVRLRGPAGGESLLRARALVNAAGPWAAAVLARLGHDAAAGAPRQRRLRLVRGSHVVVPRRFDGELAYLLQNPDRRVMFAITYEQDYTLLGTTEVEIDGEPEAAARASDDEVAYLCTHASRRLRRAVTPADVVWRYAGVRPLVEGEGEGEVRGVGRAGGPALGALSRDHLLDVQHDGAPLLTVWGGKITSYRALAEEVAGELGRLLGEARPVWTAGAALPGGDLSGRVATRGDPQADFAAYVEALRRRHAWLPAPLAQALCRRHGSRVERLLDGAAALADLGAELAPGLHAAELRWLQREEWASEVDDVLWRRSKLGLRCDAAARERLAQAMGGAAG
jgi:glycerol-3-phosphate dehydrogenase